MSYYNILGVEPLSSMDHIKDAYKIYIQKDLDDDDKRDIEKAYHTLSNYHSRRMYDNQSENSNIVKDVIASNEDTGKEFFLNKDHNDFSQIENNDNFPNSNMYSNMSFADNFDNQMINLNRRLEEIEKKMDVSNKTNFYREKRTIKETMKDNKKIITIENIINDNGNKTKSTKVIEYLEDGQNKTYFVKNKKYQKKYQNNI